MGTKSFGVDSSQVELAPVLLSNRLEGLGELSPFFRSLSEDVSQGDASLETLADVHREGWSQSYRHVASIRLRTDLTNERRAGSLCEFGD